MTDTDADSENVRPNGQRPSNNDMLVRLTVQMEQQLTISRDTLAKVEQAMSRIESTDRELAAQRIRLDAIDARTAGLSSEALGEVRGKVKEHDTRLDVMRDDAHKLRTRIQVELLKPPLFTAEDRSEIDRMLKLIAKRELTDIMTPSQRQMVAEIEVERAKGSQRSLLRRASLEQGVITFLFGAGGLALIEHFLGFH